MLDNIIQVIVLGVSALSGYLAAKGRYYGGFIASLVTQPLWFYIGWKTGAWANCIFSIWMLGCNIKGILNTRPDQNLTRGWRPTTCWEKFCWTFKIGWDACDNYGTYWHWKHKVTKNVNDKY